MVAKKIAAKAAKPKEASQGHPSRMGAPKPKDTDEYLARLDADQRSALQTLRQRIHAAHPGLTEAISYGIPFFKLGGKGLVSMGAAKTHCSLYLMSNRFMAENGPLLTGLDVEGVTVRFQPGKPLPAARVKAIVQARAQELS